MIADPSLPVPPVMSARMFGECKDRGRVLRKGEQENRPQTEMFSRCDDFRPLLAALLVLSVPSALAATKTVDITVAGFTPKNLTVDFGDTVTWTNKDTANHQVLADRGVPHFPVLGANQSYSHTFTKSGNFDYRDAFNTNRRGSITVRAGVTLKASAPWSPTADP